MRCLNTRKITSDPDDAISEIRDKSVTIVDVRRPEEYKKNHIHSAVNLPLSLSYSQMIVPNALQNL